MKRAFLAAGVLTALAAAGWWAAHRAPPTSVQLTTLREILLSKNDNDPRLDRDFNALAPETKRLFREEYRRLPRERRNELGTIVYLLGKNLGSPEDWAFLREAASEPACRSLADCARPPATPADPASGDAVTLAYPALVALKQAERVLEKDASSQEARSVIAAARDSRAPAAAALAASLDRRFR